MHRVEAERMWVKVSAGHDCQPIGYMLAGDLNGACCSLYVCDSGVCQAAARDVAEATMGVPASFHLFGTGG